MLQKKSVDNATLELLKSLQSKSYLNGFYLVGGTALALYFGHRRSIDIDLFTNVSFDAARILEYVHQDFPFKLDFMDTNTLKGSILGIKVDLIAHRYPYLSEPEFHSGIQVLSRQDIAAMKLNAISISGQRAKDFIDVYYLLEHFDLPTLLSFYKMKYSQENDSPVLKSLIYFDDVDDSGWPVLVRDTGLIWKDVKKSLEKIVMQYIRSQKRPLK